MISRSLADPEKDMRHQRSKGLDEKRRHERLSTSVDGEIKIGSDPVPVQMLDLSKSGAMLKMVTKSNNSLRVGDTVDVALVWPLSGGVKMLHVEALLVRVNDLNIAVEFTHLKSIENVH